MDFESATCPKTVLDVNSLRKMRNENDTTNKMIITTIPVCQSYKRWANVGVPTTVEEYKYPLLIALDRSDPADKKIWILDPTNAHFYETVENPAVDGIWMDVANEFLSKIHYVYKCTCPLGKCTCSENWSIRFFRCKEMRHMEIEGMDYSKKIPYLVKLNAFKWVIIVYTYQMLCGKWPYTQTEEELRTVEFFGVDEFEEAHENMEDIFEVAGTMLEQLKPGHDMEKEPKIYMNPFKPLSEVHCESCGRDEGKVAGELLKRCGRCKQIQYCCVECQKKDWPRHKKTCFPPAVDLGNRTLLLPAMQLDQATNKFQFMQATEQPTLIKKKPTFWK